MGISWQFTPKENEDLQRISDSKHPFLVGFRYFCGSL
jgi:hypothetical protein